MKEHIPQILITFGAVISILGGIMAYFQNDEFNKELKEQTELNGELTERNNQIAGDNLTLIEQNIKLSSKLLEKAEGIASTVTGGNSYCYVSLSWLKPNEATIMLINDGEYPMYKVQMRIVDLAKFHSQSSTNIDSKLGTVFNFDELTAGHAQQSGQIKVEKTSDRLSLNIFFSSRNGSFTQRLRLAKISETKWVAATKLTKTFEDELIYEKIDKDYPEHILKEQGWK